MTAFESKPWTSEESERVRSAEQPSTELVHEQRGGPGWLARVPRVPIFVLPLAGLAGATVATTIARAVTPRRRGLRAAAIGASALGLASLGALSVGALSVGAFAIGRLAIRKLDVRRLRVGTLEVAKIEGP